MATFYSEAAKGFQQAFETEALAKRMHDTIVHDAFSDRDKAFIEARNCFFLATVSEDGFPQCSYKGGTVGFVKVLAPSILAFPGYDGNGMYLSAGNIKATSKIGMLFIDFEHPNRLRVNGTASIDPNDPLLSEFPEAQFITRVEATEIFINCGRYIHPAVQQSQSPNAPVEGQTTPIADWKKVEFFQDVLPERDLLAVKAESENQSS